MICSMQEKLMNKKGKASLERDAVGRERYEEKVKTAKNTLLYTIIGVIITTSAYTIANIVNSLSV